MSFHGGMCCGIRHIYELGTDPEEMCDDELTKIPQNNNDISYIKCDQDKRLFCDAAPVETKLQRFDRYLEWLRERRPGGIVEVSIVTGSDFQWMSQDAWLLPLLERDFKEVTPEGGVYNTNSGNNVRVFMLFMLSDPVDDEDEDDYCEDDEYEID